MKAYQGITQRLMGLACAAVILAGLSAACAKDNAPADDTNSQPSASSSSSAKKSGGHATLRLPETFIKDKITVQTQTPDNASTDQNPGNKLEKATFGAGCFWCVEAVFQRIKGVEKWTSGYMGGKLKNPTYEAITTGLTGHAEVVQLEFDPEVITFEQLLDVFWRAHDPTTLNRQGADVGTQYRSAVFFHSDKQKEIALASKKATDEQKLWKDPIVTEISPAVTFYPAEGYHQNYFNINPSQGYCQVVIWPKLQKLGLPFKKDGEE